MADKAKQRTRNYTCVLYPESAPENWLQILSEQMVPLFVSPLHDKDVNEVTGEIKKAHYHIVVMFDSVKTEEQAIELFKLVNGVCPPSGRFAIHSIRGVSRYLCHLDNPEKAQYSVNDVVAMCGADYMDVIGLPTDKYNAIGEMMDFCDTFNVVSFAELFKYARMNRFDWFRILCDSGTFAMREYLKSRTWTIQNGENHLDDEGVEK